jgi:metal-responsive CopG/Arc/MetJ family transcriptional regulator
MQQERPVQVVVYVPSNVLDRLDAHVGRGERSAWIVDAIRDKMIRETLDGVQPKATLVSQ